MKKVLFIVLLLAFVPAITSAAVSYGSYVTGLQAHFEITDSAQSTINITAGIEYDPTSTNGGVYDRLYLVNRSTNNAARGLYSIDMVNQTYSARLALAGDSTNDLDEPQDVTVDASGNAYVCYIGTPSVWKVAGASSGSPVETQMLGNYEGTADDDPKALAMVPGGFGGSYTTSDVLLFDGGLDDNAYESVVVVDQTSTATSPVYNVIYSDTGGSQIAGDPVADSSAYDGYAYLSHTDPLTNQVDIVGALPKMFIYRTNSSGTLQRVFLNLDIFTLPTGLKIDDAMAINPVDGSIWIPMGTGSSETTTHIYYRIDAANMTDLGGGDFIAATTAEITLTGTDNHNIATNSMAISPDGTTLVVGNSDGVDNLHVYGIVIPEPATIALLSLGGLLLRKRK